MRFEGLNVAEFFSNIKDKLSKVTNAISGNSHREPPKSANGNKLNSPESEAEFYTRTRDERAEYVVSEDAAPLEESEYLESEYLESEYLEPEYARYPIVKRDWEGLKRLIAWLEIQPQVTSLQTKGKELLRPGLSLLGTKLPQKLDSSELRENSESPNTKLQRHTKLQESTAPQENTKKRISRPPKFWIRLGVVSIGGGALIYCLWILYTLDKGLPDVNDLSAFNRDGTLTIKAADNTILLQSGPATRDKLKLKEIPEQLVKAFIAIEDRRFYKHRGVDYQGIVRSIVSNLIERDVVQGGSTITQQLARVVFLNQERSIKRKVREALLAQKIERELSKDQVLERYLNLVYLGSDAYGVADAAWVFFSKTVDKLTLAEMATLAGLPPAPSEYSPLVNPDIAKQRRNLVLQQMQEAKVITEAQAKEAMAEPIAVKPSAPK